MGATGAIGAKYPARENSENLLILGVGGQAGTQIAATLSTWKGIKKVRVADVMDLENARKFVKDIMQKHIWVWHVENITTGNKPWDPNDSRVFSCLGFLSFLYFVPAANG